MGGEGFSCECGLMCACEGGVVVDTEAVVPQQAG